MRRQIVLSLGLLAVVGAAGPLAAEEAGGAMASSSPGEDFDLYGVLDLLQVAESVEDFESKLNDPAGELNNLDLNQDDEIDYLSVIEEVDGEVHVLIVRALLAETESQDVASVEFERKGEDVTVQVVGDPELYGEGFIVEPVTEPASAAVRDPREPILLASASSDWSRFLGPARAADPSGAEGAVLELAATVVVVRTWPAVRVIYAPGYHPWRSPYRWRRYPTHYRARRPVSRSVYRSRTSHHARKSYRRTSRRRSARAENIYRDNRKTSAAARGKAGAPGASSARSVDRPGASPGASPGTGSGMGAAGKADGRAGAGATTKSQTGKSSVNPSSQGAGRNKSSTTGRSSPKGRGSPSRGGGAPRPRR